MLKQEPIDDIPLHASDSAQMSGLSPPYVNLMLIDTRHPLLLEHSVWLLMGKHKGGLIHLNCYASLLEYTFFFPFPVCQHWPHMEIKVYLQKHPSWLAVPYPLNMYYSHCDFNTGLSGGHITECYCGLGLLALHTASQEMLGFKKSSCLIWVPQAVPLKPLNLFRLLWMMLDQRVETFSLHPCWGILFSLYISVLGICILIVLFCFIFQASCSWSHNPETSK